MVHALYRDVNGTDVRGEFTDDAGIRVRAWLSTDNYVTDMGQLYDDVFIVKQKGARRYLVKSHGTPAAEGVCNLVNTVPAAKGEMVMVGYLVSSVPPGNTQPDGAPIPINKLQKRTAIDWNDNRYTWTLENDSSADYIALTLFN